MALSEKVRFACIITPVILKQHGKVVKMFLVVIIFGLLLNKGNEENICDTIYKYFLYLCYVDMNDPLNDVAC